MQSFPFGALFCHADRHKQQHLSLFNVHHLSSAHLSVDSFHWAHTESRTHSFLFIHSFRNVLNLQTKKSSTKVHQLRASACTVHEHYHWPRAIRPTAQFSPRISLLLFFYTPTAMQAQHPLHSTAHYLSHLLFHLHTHPSPHHHLSCLWCLPFPSLLFSLYLSVVNVKLLLQ